MQNTYGSDSFIALTSIRSAIECDAIIGVKYQEAANFNQIVRESKEFMRKQETRDGMSILLVNNQEALRSIIGSEQPLELNNFAEIVVDFKDPAETFPKSEVVDNKRTLLSIVVNFLLIIGVSVFNLWQFRLLSGLDGEKKNEQSSNAKGYSISLQPIKK